MRFAGSGICPTTTVFVGQIPLIPYRPRDLAMITFMTSLVPA